LPRDAAARGLHLKHALVRDAAYGTLLRGPRQALHARIAEALEERRPEIVDASRSCLLIILPKLPYTTALWRTGKRAGERALHSAAYQEAIAHFENALTVLRS